MHLLTRLCLVFCLALSGVSFAYETIHEVPIQENGEPLVDLQDQTVIAYKSSYAALYPGCTKVRKTVYEKLRAAQDLLPAGIRFEMQIGLRSLKMQAELFEQMLQNIDQKCPHLNEKERFFEASKFTAPVKTWEGVQNVPPHSTGGAIDVFLIDEHGDPLDMGDDPNDFYNEEIIQTESPLISALARQNRTILGTALSAVGFVNYPGEYWHWSYGDRRWAFVLKSEYSIYGPVAASE